jgi:hypothetical protein
MKLPKATDICMVTLVKDRSSGMLVDNGWPFNPVSESERVPVIDSVIAELTARLVDGSPPDGSECPDTSLRDRRQLGPLHATNRSGPDSHDLNRISQGVAVPNLVSLVKRAR